MTRLEQIKKHLQDFPSITSEVARIEYGIENLTNDIYKLRQKGYKISSSKITGESFAKIYWFTKEIKGRS